MAYSAFENDYKNIIINIIQDIYSNTDYWGTSKSGTYGVTKPITDEDDTEWSNYNFINTNNYTRNNVVIPYLKKISPVVVDNIDKNKSYKQNEYNREFFKLLWEERENIFGPNSPLKDKIISLINKTRFQGNKRENYVKLSLESIPGVSVTKISESGSQEDFMGVDLIVNTTTNILPKNSSTAQVKPFVKLTKAKNNWYITTDSLRRKYETDLMIFGKEDGKECHIAVFINEPKRFIIEDNRVVIPIDLCKILINYDITSNKSVVKYY
jgi:hypothetical protein